MKKIKKMIGASILAADFANLQSECQNVLNFGADFLHVDLMDGHFVNNLTIGPPIVASLRKKLPNAYLDCHLMVTHPENYLQALAKAKINCFTFHYQANYTNLKDLLSKVRSHKIEAGISVKPGTQISENLVQLIRQGLVDRILIMTVQPGFGGQKFIQSTMTKVEELRKQFENLDIEVDGGVNESTTKIAVKSGANLLVAGSTIFGQKDRREAIHKLKYAAQSAALTQTK